MPDLLTVPEASDRLRLSRSKLYELMRSGELTFVKVGRSRRIPPSALTDFVARLIEECCP